MSEGEDALVAIPPEKSFGLYNKSLVIPVDVNRLPRMPSVGEPVTLGNMTGRVAYVNSTTALLDFNSPLAGKYAIYRIKLVKVVR